MKLLKNNINWSLNSLSKKKVSFCEKVIVIDYISENNAIKIENTTKNIINEMIDVLVKKSKNPIDHEELIRLEHQEWVIYQELTKKEIEPLNVSHQWCCFQ